MSIATTSTPLSAVPPGDVADELRWLARSGDYHHMLRRSAEIAERAADSSDHAELIGALEQLIDEGPVEALMAIESAASVPHRLADELLVDLLQHRDANLRRHASWRLGHRNPTGRAIPMLIDRIVIGGIDTMHAHRTLRDWAQAGSDSVVRSIVEWFGGWLG